MYIKSEKSSSKEYKLYNIMLPFWLLWLYPQAFVITMPINFIMDSIVLYASLRFLRAEEPFKYYKKTIFTVFSIGYIADFVGALYLIAWLVISDKLGFVFSPFDGIPSILITLSGIAISGVLIYFLNKKLFEKKKIEDAKTIAIILAIFTSPYFFLLPPL